MLVVVGARLRLARRDAGMSQDDVHRYYGIHRTYVGGVERGERNLSVLLLVRLCTVYGVDPGEVVAGLRHNPHQFPYSGRAQ